MGNDGGSIAKRRDLAKQKKIKTRVSCESIQEAKAKLCALTQEPLVPPIFVCKLGFLYNKEPLFTGILSNKLPSQFNHITSTKDVIEAKFGSNSSGLACPVSGIEYNGAKNFFVMWDCGCVLSEKALKEIFSNNCIMCSTPVTLKVKINQSKDEQKLSRKAAGIKPHKKNTVGQPVKRMKIADHEMIEKAHLDSMKSDVYKSLFNQDNENQEETFCCRHLRAGLR